MATRAIRLPHVRRRGLRRRHSLVVGFSGAIIAVVVFWAIFGELITPYDPRAQALLHAGEGPSADYWLGTDDLGRDVFSRLIAGAQTALVGPLIITVGVFVIAGVLGVTAGYRGGIVDWLVMRWVDLVYALPGLLVVIVVGGVLGGGYFLAVALLTILFTPWDTRIVRGLALEQRQLPYVEAARTLGVKRSRIVLAHIWPNVLPVALANTFLNFAYALVALSALSFLGVGVEPGTPDWGRMLADGRLLIYDNPAAALAPAAMIIATAAAMNILGDRFQELLHDRGRTDT